MATASGAAIALVLSTASCPGSQAITEGPTRDEARAKLLRFLGGVTAATRYRFQTHDDRGHTMDGAKSIQVAETSQYAAVYHWWNDTG